MIISWSHKGLQRFFETGSKVGIRPEHEKRLKLLLQLLNAATVPEDMSLPGMKFHQLFGKLASFYSVTINKNWRLIFKFENDNAICVDYVDYH